MKTQPSADVSFFEERKPIGWLLTKVAAKFEKEFFQKITREKQFSSITTSDHRVLRMITAGVTNSNDIALQTQVSKQAVSKSIASLEKRKFVLRKESKEDGRSQILLLTEKGHKLVSKAVQVAKELEHATRLQLGERDFYSLKDLLIKTL